MWELARLEQLEDLRVAGAVAVARLIRGVIGVERGRGVAPPLLLGIGAARLAASAASEAYPGRPGHGAGAHERGCVAVLLDELRAGGERHGQPLVA